MFFDANILASNYKLEIIMKILFFKKRFFIFILFFSFLACLNTGKIKYPGTSWNKSTPKAQKVNPKKLTEMIDYIKSEKLPINNILIIRNGYLITEANFGKSDISELHPIYSCTKSITSILAGITIDLGYIKNVDQKVLSFFPEKADEKNKDVFWNMLTLGHLLKMGFGHSENSFPTMMVYTDKNFNAVENIFKQKIVNKPGTVFDYDNGAPHLLSAIIQKTTGMTLSDFAKEKLFSPLGITDYKWDHDNQGITLGNTSLQLKPYDMAKIGYLMLNNGKWKDKQIVSKKWIEMATKKYLTPDLNEAENFGYGYFWWINSFGGFSAHGFRGQYIFVLPEYNLVAVMTGEFDDSLFPINHNLMRDFILKALK